MWFSPHGSDQEVQDSDDGDADEDVQGPLDHGAASPEVDPDLLGASAAAQRAVRPAGVRHGGLDRRGVGGGHVCGQNQQPTCGHDHYRENSPETHLHI